MLSSVVDLLGELINAVVAHFNWVGTEAGAGSSGLSSDGLGAELSGQGMSS